MSKLSVPEILERVGLLATSVHRAWDSDLDAINVLAQAVAPEHVDAVSQSSESVYFAYFKNDPPQPVEKLNYWKWTDVACCVVATCHPNGDAPFALRSAVQALCGKGQPTPREFFAAIDRVWTMDAGPIDAEQAAADLATALTALEAR